MLKYIAIAIVGLSLAGCQTTQQQRAAEGAVLGGAVGAVAGGIATGSAKGIAVGAAAGAATGALIGAVAGRPGYCYYRASDGRRVVRRCR